METSVDRNRNSAAGQESVHVILLCAKAKELEDAGAYEEARSLFGSEVWRGAGFEPRLTGLDERAQAELLLRAGALTGWLGSSQQLPSIQERAKDLISRSQRLFEELNEPLKSVEAVIEMSVCYWREGAFDEGRALLRDALSRSQESDYLTASALLRLGVIEFHARDFQAGLTALEAALPLAKTLGAESLLGRIYNQRAAILMTLGQAEARTDDMDLAFEAYTAASIHFENAGHLRYLGRVENNLALLYSNAHRFPEAHEHLDKAGVLFRQTKDVGSAAQVGETRARIFLAEDRAAEAEASARAAVKAFRAGGEQSLLAEALTTHGIACARLGRLEEARAAWVEAGDTAAAAGDPAIAAIAALTACEELAGRAEISELCRLYLRADSFMPEKASHDLLARLRACARRLVQAPHGEAHQSLPDIEVRNVSPISSRLLDTARLCAPLRQPVLLLGETGPGKSTLARLMHEWSGRGGSFVVVHCGSPAPDWARLSEPGIGVIFFDAIDALAPRDQEALSRLLHKQGSQPRVIAATRHDLVELIARREFSDRLYFFFAGCVLTIPPLRQRPEDVAEFVRWFAADAKRDLGGQSAQFTPAAVAALQSLPLYGNIPELRSLILRLTLARCGGAVRPHDVEALARQTAPEMTSDAPRFPCVLNDELKKVERRLIEEALRASGGQVSRAAELLGFTHHESLVSKLKKYPDLKHARTPPRRRRRSIIKLV